MQIRLPRPKDQPPRRKRPPIVSTADNPVCAICNKQISRYHCPTCNLPYCSLACYKSPQHEDCSERFDRQTLVDEIKSAEGKTGKEKKAMMDMLKRFEEENGEEEEDEDQEGRSQERAELEKRLQGVDLDALPPDELLAFLSPAQQAAFTSTLSDPDRINALVTQELETEQPWWIDDDEEEDFDEEEEKLDQSARRPPMLEVASLPVLPLDDGGKPKPSPTLVYNIVAVLIAYSYTLRTFSLTSFSALSPRSSERIPATQMFSQLVPFLVERSTTTLDNLDGAIEYVASREQSIISSPQLVALLLHDLSKLLQPSSISENTGDSTAEANLASHPSANILLALSDLHHLFTSVTATAPASTSSTTLKPSLISRPSTVTPLSKAQRNQASMASHKLLFYASFLAHPKSPVDTRLVASIANRAERGADRREVEEQKREEATKQRSQDISSKLIVEEKPGVRFTEKDDEVESKPRIVEIE